MQNVLMQTNIPLYRSIRGQLIFWFLMLGLIPLIVMGGVSFINANNALEDSIANTLQGLAHARAIELEAWLGDTGRMAEALAAMGGLRGADGVDNMGLQVITSMRNRADDSERYQNAYDTALLAMNAFKNVYNRVDEAFLIDSNGIIVISTNQGLIRDGTRVADIPNIDFEAGLRGTDIGDIVTSVDGLSRIFVVVTPVIGPSSTTIGVLALRVNLNTINQIMGDYTGLGDTGEQYLISLEDRLMRTPSRFGDVDFQNQRVNTFAIEQALAGIDQVTAQYTDYRGIEVLGSWDRIDGTDWLLLAEIDIDEAFAPVTALGNTILVIVVIATIILLVVSIWIAISISRPIVAVSQAAARVADGALDERVDLKSRNEIGMLGGAFNQMTANLRQMVEAEREGKSQLEATVTQYSQFIETVAQGNLTEKLQLNGSKGQDELLRLGENLNTMVDSLREMAVQISDTVTSLSATVTQIQAATTQQTASATEQDASVTQTVATVEEVRTTVQQTAQRAQAVSDASQQSVQVSRDGQQAVTDTLQGMETLRQRVSDIAENILMLSERTQQIGEIIETVNALAEQSKLLALNASIEAARAGEEGKGFAVVAMEVRQLAEQSRDATARVRGILSEIQQATNTAVMVTEEGSKGAENGMRMAQDAGEAIRNLAGTIEEAAQAALQIAASTNQQTNGMDQLAAAMTQIQQAATQTAASTRQTEQSLHDLNEMAKRLEQAVRRYEI